MLLKLRLAHRLLLIYLLSFVSVAVLAYSLVVEKNIAIEFAEKEQRGNSYVTVVRDALLAIVEDRLASMVQRPNERLLARDVLQREIAALQTAEQAFGHGMDTAVLADRLVKQLSQLKERDDDDLAIGWALYMQSVRTARQLISRIGDQSNLILDPDLDSYYMMSIVILRLPEFTTAAVDLVDTATSTHPSAAHSGESRATLLLKKGAFAATIAALASDSVRVLAELRDTNVRSQLQTLFMPTQSAAMNLSMSLRSATVNPMEARPILRRFVSATDSYWTQAGVELEQLLQQRVDRLYRKMAIDLSAAGLVWLMALAAMLFIARQITQPIRHLAEVAERVRYGEDYDLRAQTRSGGEIGSLVGGFNAMLDRLKHEAIGEQERVARDHAATAQRQLLEAVPVVVSVASEADGRILYSNADLARPSWVPSKSADPGDMLKNVYPADRSAFLEA